MEVWRADYLSGMRAAALIIAMLAFATSASAEQCFYESENDQRIDWRGGDTITVDPRYTDAFSCDLVSRPDNPNWFTAKCGAWTADFITGASSRTTPASDILVWDGVFFWLKCAKDGA